MSASGLTVKKMTKQMDIIIIHLKIYFIRRVHRATMSSSQLETRALDSYIQSIQIIEGNDFSEEMGNVDSK